MVFGLPVLGTTQRGFTRLGGQELVYLGEFQRQLALVEHIGHALLVIYREGFTPVTLAAEDGIAQTVVHLYTAYAFLFNEFLGSGNGILYLHAVQVETVATRVYHLALLGIETLFRHVAPLDQGNDRQVEMFGKGVVAAIVSRYRHDGTRTVTGQYIVAHVDRNMFVVQRVDGIGTRKHTRHAAVHQALAFGAVFDALEVFVDSLFLLGSYHLLHILAFGSQYHEGNPEYRIGTRREDGKLYVRVYYLELHLGTLRTAYPVLLRLFQRVGPVEFVESVEQTLGISRYPEAPLAHHLLLYGIATPYRYPFAHLVVGQYRTQFRTPVYHRVAQVSNAVVHQRLLLFLLVLGFPLVGRERKLFAAGGIQPFSAFRLEMFYQLFNRTGLLPVVVVVAVEHLYEGPLGPLVILGIAGANLAAPVVAETNLVQLLTIAIYILLGRNGRMLSGLYRILFGRKSISIVTHGVEHVETFQPFVTGIDVRSNISQRVTYVQTCTRRIGEHVQYVVFGFLLVFGNLVDVMLFPVLLPLFLYFFEIVFHDEQYVIGDIFLVTLLLNSQ